MKLRIGCLMLLSFLLALPAASQDATDSGTVNYIPIWTGTTTLGNSTIFEAGGMVGVGTTTPTATLSVIGPNAPPLQNAKTVLRVTGGKGGTGNFGGLAGSGIQLTSGIGGTGGGCGVVNCSYPGGPGGSIQITGGGGGGSIGFLPMYGPGGSIQITGGLGSPGGSITLQPGSGKCIRCPGNVIMALPFGGKVGIGTSTPANMLEVVAGGTTLADAWTTRSSVRFKTNIHTLEGALERVERLRGVSYDSKADGKHEIGVIAEEVGQVLPEIVSYEENGVDAQGVDYSRLAALLIEAVKSQEAKIQQLSAEIQQLKSNSISHY